MGCHLGWYSTVGSPLRAAEENKYKKGAPGLPKTIKEKKVMYSPTVLTELSISGTCQTSGLLYFSLV
jgi:hypothetical protein